MCAMAMTCEISTLRIADFLDRPRFLRITQPYRKAWQVDVCLCDELGVIVHRSKPRCCSSDASAQRARQWTIGEALRWGEPTIELGPGQRLMWAAPLMINDRLIGGITASVPEQRVLEKRIDIRRACTELRTLAEVHHLTNSALLAARRAEYERERQRAQAIHVLKQTHQVNLRQLILTEEPTMLAAIRRGDRGGAREALNRLLVAMHHQAGDNVDLIRSFFMELVVTMTRTAVEAGGAAEDLLGSHYAGLTQVAEMDDLPQLANWLRHMLEQVMQSLHLHRESTDAVLLAAAVRHMSEHCGQNLSRDEVAEIACMSPSHFSRSIKRMYGMSFTQMLNQMRIERAAELLLRTDRPLSLIALDCGFADQSYFTKVFRRHKDCTPSQYRAAHGIAT